MLFLFSINFLFIFQAYKLEQSYTLLILSSWFRFLRFTNSLHSEINQLIQPSDAESYLNDSDFVHEICGFKPIVMKFSFVSSWSLDLLYYTVSRLLNSSMIDWLGHSYSPLGTQLGFTRHISSQLSNLNFVWHMDHICSGTDVAIQVIFEVKRLKLVICDVVAVQHVELIPMDVNTVFLQNLFQLQMHCLAAY